MSSGRSDSSQGADGTSADHHTSFARAPPGSLGGRGRRRRLSDASNRSRRSASLSRDSGNHRESRLSPSPQRSSRRHGRRAPSSPRHGARRRSSSSSADKDQHSDAGRRGQRPSSADAVTGNRRPRPVGFRYLTMPIVKKREGRQQRPQESRKFPCVRCRNQSWARHDRSCPNTNIIIDVLCCDDCKYTVDDMPAFKSHIVQCYRALRQNNLQRQHVTGRGATITRHWAPKIYFCARKGCDFRTHIAALCWAHFALCWLYRLHFYPQKTPYPQMPPHEELHVVHEDAWHLPTGFQAAVEEIYQFLASPAGDAALSALARYSAPDRSTLPEIPGLMPKLARMHPDYTGCATRRPPVSTKRERSDQPSRNERRETSPARRRARMDVDERYALPPPRSAPVMGPGTAPQALQPGPAAEVHERIVNVSAPTPTTRQEPPTLELQRLTLTPTTAESFQFAGVLYCQLTNMPTARVLVCGSLANGGGEVFADGQRIGGCWFTNISTPNTSAPTQPSTVAVAYLHANVAPYAMVGNLRFSAHIAVRQLVLTFPTANAVAEFSFF